jgi:hypothetical protein
VIRLLLELDTGADRRSAVHLVEDEYGLLVGVSNPGGTRFSTLTADQAEQLERALYLHRITRPFIERQNTEEENT